MLQENYFGVETEKDPDIWADRVRADYDRQLAKGSNSITLSDGLLWSMPAADLTPFLAARGIQFAICENRNNRIATYIDPLPGPNTAA